MRVVSDLLTRSNVEMDVASRKKKKKKTLKLINDWVIVLQLFG